MMVRRYKSFEEIDNRLRILKLQREIDQESLKLRLNRAKAEWSPRTLVQVVGSAFTPSGIWKQLLLAVVLKKALARFRKRHTKAVEKEPKSSNLSDKL